MYTQYDLRRGESEQVTARLRRLILFVNITNACARTHERLLRCTTLLRNKMYLHFIDQRTRARARPALCAQN